MAYLRALGRYVPARVVDNVELAAVTGAAPEWILEATGIRERRNAAPEETVVSMGVAAARECLGADDTAGLILAASGSGERRFPGPAAEIGAALGLSGVPAIDIPIASAGSLFALALAADLCATYGNVLVVASEIMSRAVGTSRDTAILFGDGAGACVVSPKPGFARIAGSLLMTDGTFADALRLDHGAPLHMDGRTIILQAARKLPRAIADLLERHQLKPADVGTFLLHQANLNLITRVARALDQPESRFYRNLERYGNTSSASLLIAAAEWWRDTGRMEAPAVLAAFGAGLNWGALLALPAD
jgi:3-oxoacyl-[acyl-carrier-protein] synthase-3